jgi:DNA-binding MarR family transcriptional regulator
MKLTGRWELPTSQAAAMAAKSLFDQHRFCWVYRKPANLRSTEHALIALRALPLAIMPSSATLPVLLWSVLKDLEREYASEGATGIEMPSLDLWANLLRVLGESVIDARELPELVRLSKRAVRTRIATGIRRGWVEPQKIGQGRTTISLTTRGRDVARRWKPLQESAEKLWQEKTSRDRTSCLRLSLNKIVAAFPMEHPHYPASYGSADASITGRNGRDWRPVFRKSGDTVSALCTSALISQALVAFAMDYEKMSPVALSLSTTVIKRIPPEGELLKELGDSAGVSALVRHGFLRVAGDGSTMTAFLTPKGLSVAAEYDERIRKVEAGWRHRFGNDSVEQLRRALEQATGSVEES